MADDVDLPDANNQVFKAATRDKGGREVQLVQLDLGDANTVAPVEGAFPVRRADGSALASDAQLATAINTLASILAALQAPLAVGGVVEVANDGGSPLPVSGSVSVTGSVTASGPLTDTQLRAAAVPVSGPLTDAQLRAANVPVVAAATDGKLDTANAALGAPTDAEATGDGTLTAILKRVRTFVGRLPVLGPAVMAACLPVTIASDQTPIPTVENALVLTGQAAQVNTVNNILEAAAGAGWTDVSNYRSASVQVVSTATGGALIFEQSNDGVSPIALPVFNAALVTAVPITGNITPTASQIIYTFPIRARFMRLRIATTLTGGNVQAFSRLSTEPWTPAAMLVASNTAANLLSQVSGTVTANLGAATTRAGFVAGAGIWYDDSSTALAANASFTGTSRDATVTASATAIANAGAYTQEIRLSAESDQSGTLWLEVSRDNTNWRRVKSVATAAIAGGGQYAEIVHRPSWRYWRAGFTNGATLQTRFSLGSLAMAA